MEIVNKLFENFFTLANAMSFYILLGLLIAGILKQIIPDNFIQKHLSKNSFISVIKATIFGIPLPVCSCSVIPLAKSLQKEGASRGAVQSFLISTPITGVDSILATYSFFGWIFTIYRIVTSVIIAIVVGVIENIFNKNEQINEVKSSCGCSDENCSTPKNGFVLNSTTPKVTSFAMSHRSVQNEDSCCSGSSCCDSKKNKKFSIKAIFNYAFNTLFGDIAKSLFIGLIFGALFTTFLPKELLNSLYQNQFLTYFLVLIVAMPLYVCATSSLPIAASFLISGMSPGAAFVFLSAGPATNSVTMGVVAQMFGKRSLFIYVGAIAILSIIFGTIFDHYFGTLQIINISNSIEETSILNIFSTIIMIGLMIFYIFRK